MYGVAQVPVSPEFPQGQVVTPLEGISDAEVKPGEKLKDILKASVVIIKK